MFINILYLFLHTLFNLCVLTYYVDCVNYVCILFISLFVRDGKKNVNIIFLQFKNIIILTYFSRFNDKKKLFCTDVKITT